MLGIRGAAESPAPDHLLARPSAPGHAIDRPDVLARLERAVQAHRVVLVVAPAGYGKTAALSAWAELGDRRIGWLSLTASDKHPQRLERGLVSALEPILGAGAVDLADLLRRDAPDSILAVDDIHLVGPAAAGVLGLLLDRAPAGLRIVLASRRRPELRLQRINAAGGLGELSMDQLAFTAEEIRAAAGRLGRRLSDQQADRLRELTDGWPVAVRLALMSGVEPLSRLAAGGQLRLSTLTDYLVEEVLGDLPTGLHDFLLRVSVADWLTGRLATELADDELAPAMLEDAVTRGIPLERRGVAGGEPVYRWHPLVAEQCRILLSRRDPVVADELHVRAARFLAGSDPARGARHALAGRAPRLAYEIVLEHWLSLVLRGDSAVLDDVCLQLPAPESDSPDILLIRATCRRAVDDVEAAGELRSRAQRLAVGQDAEFHERHLVTRMLAELLVVDAGDQLLIACHELRQVLSETSLLRGAQRACAWFLVAFTEMRLRRTTTAVSALREAAVAARAEGLDDIADRAVADLVFALAFNGDFQPAEALLVRSPGDDQARWRRTEGRPEWFAAAWMSFWRDDLERAQLMFARCIAAGGAVTSFATMSRIWTTVAAARLGEPGAIRAAEAGLLELPDGTVGGLPLTVYKGVAQAQVALARNRPESAVAILDGTRHGATDAPAALVFAAEIYLSCERVASARACLTELESVDTLPPYVAVAAQVIGALVADSDGRTDLAHAGIERALEWAGRDTILLPFVRSDPRLRALLAAHAHAGTAHESLLAIVLARQEAGTTRSLLGGVALSAREREVLGYLQTGLSSAEIASALHISANTLKSHQRAIYRKLGVGSRREAIRVARSQRIGGP